MKKIILLSISLILCFTLTNCSEENYHTDNDLNQEISFGSEIKSTLLINYQIPKTEVNLLQKIGFSGSSVQVYENYNPATEEKYISYLAEGDIELKSSDLIKMVSNQDINKEDNENKQYRTTRVPTSGIYKILYISNSTEISTAIDMAINNYNSLNLDIGFERIYFPTSFENFTGRRLRNERLKFINESGAITVENANLGGAGGRAGFPRYTQTNRRPIRYEITPYKEIKIDLETVPFGLDVLEHVITHEIGHCIGLRHTDYARRRCEGDNEGASSWGAIHIPGTPTVNQWGAGGLDADSIMISCFDAFEDGEFSTDDITALRAIW